MALAKLPPTPLGPTSEYPTIRPKLWSTSAATALRGV